MASINGLYNGGYDISNRNKSVYSQDYDAYVNRWEEEEKLKQLYEDKGTLDFQDMLQLMVAQFQNQTIDDQASTSDMMNQLVQMSTMQAMNQMVDHVEELRLANVMSYAASLVTREVTVFDGYDENGKMKEFFGKVKGMGTYGGQPVIFVGDDYKMYYLSDILAVGELPPPDEEVEHAEGCEDPGCKGECTKEPQLPEDTEVKIPDKLDPDFNQGEAPEVKVPDNLDPGYGVGGKDDD